MGLAYQYVDGNSPIPEELEAAYMIERYGVQAVYGRQMSVIEMRSINAAKRVVDAYRSRSQSEDWAAWCSENPEDNRILERAMNNG